MLPNDEVGRGPVVVLLHAGICDRSMWTEHLESVAAAGHRALAVDLPGFGEAEVRAGEQAPWIDVLATLDDLGIEAAALVGNSFGGAVALRIAAVAPQRVTALAVVSAPAPGLQPSPELEAAWEAEEAALERGDLDAAVEVVLDTWTLPDAPATVRERVAAMQRRTYELQGAATEVTEAPDPVEADPSILTRLDRPALVMVGDRDLPDFKQGAEQLTKALPKVRLEVIEEAGHLAPLEEPDAFRRLLMGFLDAQ